MGIAERKEREKEQRKNELVDAAEKVFFGKGFESATMDEIAEVAEYSKGTLYLYFKSKEDLYFEIFIRGMNILKEMMLKELPAAKNGLQKLETIGRTFFVFAEQYPNHINAIISIENKELHSSIDPEKLKAFISGDSPLRILVQATTEGIEDKSIKSDCPALPLATTLWAQTLGILTVIYKKCKVVEHLSVSPDDLIKLHFEVLINGIRKK